MTTQRMFGFFLSFILLMLMVGCFGPPDEVELCYDMDNDYECDDGSGKVNPNDYIMLNGRKTKIYLKDADSLVQ